MARKKSSKSAGKHRRQEQDDGAESSHCQFSRFFEPEDPQSSWDRDSLGDVLHWIRQGVALICGFLWGAIPLVGGVWFFAYILVATTIVYTYYAKLLLVDDEQRFGRRGILLREGIYSSTALFLATWIMVYTLFHC